MKRILYILLLVPFFTFGQSSLDTIQNAESGLSVRGKLNDLINFTKDSVLTDLTAVDSIVFVKSGSFAYLDGMMFYDSNTYTLNFYNGFPGFIHQLGQELVMIARNVTGVTIADAKPVYISGATGQLPEISLASAMTQLSSNVAGFTTIEFLNNAFGVVTISGAFSGASTAGYDPGKSLYLGITPGTYDTAQVLFPYHNVHLGNVLYANVNNGRIQINIHHLEKRGVEASVPFVNGGLELGFDYDNFNYDTVLNSLNISELKIRDTLIIPLIQQHGGSPNSMTFQDYEGNDTITLLYNENNYDTLLVDHDTITINLTNALDYCKFNFSVFNQTSSDTLWFNPINGTLDTIIHGTNNQYILINKDTIYYYEGEKRKSKYIKINESVRIGMNVLQADYVLYREDNYIKTADLAINTRIQMPITSFDGSSSYLSKFSPNSLTDSFNLEVFIRPDTVNIYQAFVARHVGTDYFTFGTFTGNKYAVILGATVNTSVNCTLAKNEWAKVNFIYNGSTVSVYKNDVLEGTTGAITWATHTDENKLYVGGWTSSLHYKGDMAYALIHEGLSGDTLFYANTTGDNIIYDAVNGDAIPIAYGSVTRDFLDTNYNYYLDKGYTLASHTNEILINQSFDSTNYWTIGASTAITGGELVFTAADAAASQLFSNNRSDTALFNIYVNVSSYTGGDLVIRFPTGVADTISSAGAHNILLPGSDVRFFYLDPIAATMSIDSVSVTEIGTSIIPYKPDNTPNISIDNLAYNVPYDANQIPTYGGYMDLTGLSILDKSGLDSLAIYNRPTTDNFFWHTSEFRRNVIKFYEKTPNKIFANVNRISNRAVGMSELQLFNTALSDAVADTWRTDNNEVLDLGNKYLFEIIGQSNTNGTMSIADSLSIAYQGLNDSVKIWNGTALASLNSAINNNQYPDQDNRYSFDIPFMHLFADSIQQSYNVIKVARGGADVDGTSSSNSLSYGEYDLWWNIQKAYEYLKDNETYASKNLISKMLYYQGEAESVSLARAQNWENVYKIWTYEYVNKLLDFGNFIDGNISHASIITALTNSNNGTYPNRTDTRSSQITTANNVDYVYYIDADGSQLSTDDIHHTREGYEDIAAKFMTKLNETE